MLSPRGGSTNRMPLACGMLPNEEYHALAR